MNSLTLRVAGPTLIFGVLLSATCLSAAWQINRLDHGFARILPRKVAAAEAAERLEILLRELRFLHLQSRLSPSHDRKTRIDNAHRDFKESLGQAREAIADPGQLALIDDIDRAFQTYLSEARADAAPFVALAEAQRWTGEHPISDAVGPCRELLAVNNREVREAVEESQGISQRAQAALLLFCVLGPIGGFVSGFGTARGLHQSITRMLVLVRDVHAELDREVGLLDVNAGSGLAVLDERLARFIERVREVTRQVQRQQQELLRGEQMAAVGQLAAAVAHEVRNPLTGIKLLIETAQRRTDRPGLSNDDLFVIHRELVRLEGIVQGLLDYSRPPALHAATDDIRQAVLQANELARSRARMQGVDVRLELPTEPVMTRHDRDQIAAVVGNLIRNSLDALPKGGIVRIAVSGPLNGQVQVTVLDNGPGLPPHILARLFTPFTSTKPTGTGLGLSLSRRLARQHGGDLTAAAAPGGGACFTLTLPEHGPETPDV